MTEKNRKFDQSWKERDEQLQREKETNKREEKKSNEKIEEIQLSKTEIGLSADEALELSFGGDQRILPENEIMSVGELEWLDKLIHDNRNLGQEKITWDRKTLSGAFCAIDSDLPLTDEKVQELVRNEYATARIKYFMARKQEEQKIKENKMQLQLYYKLVNKVDFGNERFALDEARKVTLKEKKFTKNEKMQYEFNDMFLQPLTRLNWSVTDLNDVPRHFLLDHKELTDQSMEVNYLGYEWLALYISGVGHKTKRAGHLELRNRLYSCVELDVGEESNFFNNWRGMTTYFNGIRLKHSLTSRIMEDIRRFELSKTDFANYRDYYCRMDTVDKDKIQILERLAGYGRYVVTHPMTWFYYFVVKRKSEKYSHKKNWYPQSQLWASDEMMWLLVWKSAQKVLRKVTGGSIYWTLIPYQQKKISKWRLVSTNGDVLPARAFMREYSWLILAHLRDTASKNSKLRIPSECVKINNIKLSKLIDNTDSSLWKEENYFGINHTILHFGAATSLRLEVFGFPVYTLTTENDLVSSLMTIVTNVAALVRTAISVQDVDINFFGLNGKFYAQNDTIGFAFNTLGIPCLRVEAASDGGGKYYLDTIRWAWEWIVNQKKEELTKTMSYIVETPDREELFQKRIIPRIKSDTADCLNFWDTLIIAKDTELLQTYLWPLILNTTKFFPIQFSLNNWVATADSPMSCMNIPITSNAENTTNKGKVFGYRFTLSGEPTKEYSLSKHAEEAAKNLFVTFGASGLKTDNFTYIGKDLKLENEALVKFMGMALIGGITKIKCSHLLPAMKITNMLANERCNGKENSAMWRRMIDQQAKEYGAWGNDKLLNEVGVADIPMAVCYGSELTRTRDGPVVANGNNWGCRVRYCSLAWFFEYFELPIAPNFTTGVGAKMENVFFVKEADLKNDLFMICLLVCAFPAPLMQRVFRDDNFGGRSGEWNNGEQNWNGPNACQFAFCDTQGRVILPGSTDVILVIIDRTEEMPKNRNLANPQPIPQYQQEFYHVLGRPLWHVTTLLPENAPDFWAVVRDRIMSNHRLLTDYYLKFCERFGITTAELNTAKDIYATCGWQAVQGVTNRPDSPSAGVYSAGVNPLGPFKWNTRDNLADVLTNFNSDHFCLVNGGTYKIEPQGHIPRMNFRAQLLIAAGMVAFEELDDPYLRSWEDDVVHGSTEQISNEMILRSSCYWSMVSCFRSVNDYQSERGNQIFTNSDNLPEMMAVWNNQKEMSNRGLSDLVSRCIYNGMKDGMYDTVKRKDTIKPVSVLYTQVDQYRSAATFEAWDQTRYIQMHCPQHLFVLLGKEDPTSRFIDWDRRMPKALPITKGDLMTQFDQKTGVTDLKGSYSRSQLSMTKSNRQELILTWESWFDAALHAFLGARSTGDPATLNWAFFDVPRNMADKYAYFGTTNAIRTDHLNTRRGWTNNNRTPKIFYVSNVHIPKKWANSNVVHVVNRSLLMAQNGGTGWQHTVFSLSELPEYHDIPNTISYQWTSIGTGWFQDDEEDTNQKPEPKGETQPSLKRSEHISDVKDES